jgi:hypothetical protein
MISWDKFKKKALQLIGGLFMENKEGEYVVSVGRVSWWVAFLPAVAIWVSSGGSLEAGEAIKDISPNYFSMLVILAGYNLSKHATGAIKDIFGKNNNRPG